MNEHDNTILTQEDIFDPNLFNINIFDFNIEDIFDTAYYNIKQNTNNICDDFDICNVYEKLYNQLINDNDNNKFIKELKIIVNMHGISDFNKIQIPNFTENQIKSLKLTIMYHMNSSYINSLIQYILKQKSLLIKYCYIINTNELIVNILNDNLIFINCFKQIILPQFMLINSKYQETMYANIFYKETYDEICNRIKQLKKYFKKIIYSFDNFMLLEIELINYIQSINYIEEIIYKYNSLILSIKNNVENNYVMYNTIIKSKDIIDLI